MRKGHHEQTQRAAVPGGSRRQFPAAPGAARRPRPVQTERPLEGGAARGRGRRDPRHREVPGGPRSAGRHRRRIQAHLLSYRLSGATGRRRHARPIQTEDFKFLKSVTKRMPKVTIPSPTMLHFRGGRAAISKEAYPDMDAFYDDVARCYRDELKQLGTEGCTYVQLDDTNLAYLCDPKIREGARSRGDDPDELPRRYAGLINAAIADRPAGMTICTHLCRGNFKSAWVAEGGYEPVAEVLFNDLNVDGYFLEYDDERSGDFRPLRFLPKGKTMVLGLVTTKLGEVESKDAIKRRIDEASKYAPLDQFCLSPQCGFSSTVHGNDIEVASQANKLKLIV